MPVDLVQIIYFWTKQNGPAVKAPWSQLNLSNHLYPSLSTIVKGSSFFFFKFYVPFLYPNFVATEQITLTLNEN